MTYTVLSTIGGLDLIAEWSAFHHEKLDGSGYPFHIKVDKINTGARIMAVADICLKTDHTEVAWEENK